MPFPDVLIVGAGTAGCVLAARLSEDDTRTVLLLEAGPDYPSPDALPSEIASGFSLVVSHDWGFAGEGAEAGHVVPAPRPRLVGGSSATNATIALRGTPADYDEWEGLGNDGWSFRDVLPCFRKLETDLDFDGPAHGLRGPLPIRRYRRDELTPVQAAFVQAAREVGHTPVADLNAPGAVGVGALPMNTVAGLRRSAALSYLAPARERPNLTIRSHALVDQIMFNGSTATGVRLAPSGESIHAGHVILAAGAYCSPMILMRSGIGPSEHLTSMGIAVRADVEGVGRGLLDHPLWALHFAAPASAASESAPMFQTMLSMSASHDHADGAIDAQVFPTTITRCGVLQSASRAKFTICVSSMKPRSRGDVGLTSCDPSAPPTIRFRHLSHRADMEVMLAAVREARQIAGAPGMAELALQELYPGTALDDRGRLETCLRRSVTTYHHAAGTCRMGPARDPTAVVDQVGAVHGFSRLSVIDASLMPTIPAANIHLTTLMLAERCVELGVPR